jgi:hypothetical protein
MNWKKFFIAFVAAFIFMFLFEWLFHGRLLRGTYMETPALWRQTADYNRHFYLLVFGEAIIALMLTMIFAVCCGGGIAAGVGLGIMLAVLYIGATLITYAVQPLPTKLIVFWSIGGLVEYSIAGAIIGASYKSTVASA